MGATRKLAAIVLAPGLLVWVSGVAFTVVEQSQQGRCNPWLECVYASQLAAFIFSLVLVCSAAGFLIAGLSQLNVVRGLGPKVVATLVLVLAALQVAMFFGLEFVTFEESASVAGILFAWVILSGIVCWLGLAAARRLAPNNSSKPTPLRGAA